MNATYTINDLLKVETQGLIDFGVENVAKTLQERLAYINAEVDNQLSDLTEKTSQSRRLWGGSASGTMQEFSDDIGVPEPHKDEPGVAVHFPLRRFGDNYSRSKVWEMTATPADVARAFNGVETRYMQRILDELAFGIYNDDNYSFVDKFGDQQTLSVKAFLNADSAAIPPSPSGATFDASTHNHYLGTAGASLATADIDALITHVVEHFANTNMALFVNQADVSVIAALTNDKFEPLTYGVLAVPARSSGTLQTQNPAIDDRNSKLWGYWDGVPVYSRPWAKDNYIVAVNLGASEKPLVYRTFSNAALQGLIPDLDVREGMVLAKYYHAFFGIGAWNRAAVAVLDTAHQTNYTEPTLIR